MTRDDRSLDFDLVAVLCLLIPNIAVLGLFTTLGGFAWGLENREAAFEPAEWVSRARRALANLVENLTPFAILILVAQLSGKANDATGLRATLFFWSRVAHFLVHTAGIPYVRTAAFAASLTGQTMILRQLFSSDVAG